MLPRKEIDLALISLCGDLTFEKGEKAQQPKILVATVVKSRKRMEGQTGQTEGLIDVPKIDR